MRWVVGEDEGQGEGESEGEGEGGGEGELVLISPCRLVGYQLTMREDV